MLFYHANIVYHTMKEGGEMKKAICVKTRDSIGKLNCKLYSIVEIKDIYHTFYGLQVKGQNELVYYDQKCFREVRTIDPKHYEKVSDLLKLVKNVLNNPNMSLIDQANTIVVLGQRINEYLRR